MSDKEKNSGLADSADETMRIDVSQEAEVSADALAGKTAVMEPVPDVADTSGIDVGADGNPVDGEAIEATGEIAPVEPGDGEGEGGEPSPRRKKAMVAVGAVVAVAVIGAIVAGVTMQPATSGASSSGSSSSAAAASTTASKSATSASASSAASSASATSSGAATAASGSSASASANSGGSAKTEAGDTSSDNGGGNGSTGNAGGNGGGGEAAAPAAQSGGNGGESTSNGGGGNAAPQHSEPAHVHNWVPITESVEVVVQPARTEEYSVIVCSNGMEFGSQAELIAYSDAHPAEDFSYSVVTRTNTIPAVTEWQEQVVGYRCSGCGAVQ